MRRIKTIQIQDRGEVTVREVSPAGVYRALSGEDRFAQFRALIDDSVTPGWDDLQNWWMSEIEQVLAAWLEVNEAFFGVARALKVDDLALALVKTFKERLPELYARSLNGATPTLGTTAGASS